VGYIAWLFVRVGQSAHEKSVSIVLHCGEYYQMQKRADNALLTPANTRTYAVQGRSVIRPENVYVDFFSLLIVYIIPPNLGSGRRGESPIALGNAMCYNRCATGCTPEIGFSAPSMEYLWE
jgi:hypothetical protein